MRYLENLNDTSVIKHGDSSETLRLSARNDNEPVTWSEGDVAEVHVDQIGKKVAAKLVVGSNNILVDSGDLADIPAGKYGLELWVTLKSGKTAIWPSDGSLEITIDKNSDEITGDTVTTITLEDLEKRVDDKIDEGLKNIKIDPSKIPSVDLSGYAKKNDVPSVIYDKDSHTLTVNGIAVDIPADVDLSGYAKLSDLPHVDLTPYLTKTDADSKYAIKADVPSVKYDKNSRTLTVDGQVVSLPASVDLSDYAKTSQLSQYALKSSIPNIALDVAKRTLSLNGTTITIPQEVDLSKYALSSQIPSVTLSTDTHTLTVDGVAVHIPADVDLSPYAKSADVEKEIDQKLGSIPAVDLTGYVKKADLDDYARKTDIPVVPEIKLDTTKRTITVDGQELDIPNTVDLSQYARVDAVPKIALDTEKRTITVNEKEIDVPRDVDLSGYVTKAELTSKLANVQSGGKIDLTGYVTKADADETYAKKTDVTGMLTKTEADDEYAAKNDVPSVAYNADTKTLTVNGQTVKVPAEIDLSDYAKKSDIKTVDLTPYITTESAEGEFAKKADVPQISYDADAKTLTVNGKKVTIPDSVDLGEYAKKSEIPAPVDLTPYVKKTDADVKYAAKSDIPSVIYDKDKKTLTVNGQVVDIPANIDLSGYMKSSDAETEFAKKSDVKNVDLTPYIKTADVEQEFAKKSDVPSVVYDDNKKTLTVNGSTIDLSDSSSGSAIWFKSDAVDTSITWTYNGHTSYQTPISSLIGKGGDAATKVTSGNVVIDGTGRAFTIYGTTGDNENAELIEIGSTAGKGVQAKTITDWNAYQGGLGTAPMQYYGKQSIKQALQLDNSKTYTMDLDAGTLVNETDKTTQKMLPGIYQLRDISTDVSNLTIKSDSNFGGNGGTPVQATITPYEIDVVLVNGADVSKAWRSCWLADQSSWYGVTDKWHIEK